MRRARPASCGHRDCCSISRSTDRCRSADSDCSILKRSAAAVSGLQNRKFTPITMMAMVAMARPTPRRSPLAMAAAAYEPTPGSG